MQIEVRVVYPANKLMKRPKQRRYLADKTIAPEE